MITAYITDMHGVERLLARGVGLRPGAVPRLPVGTAFAVAQGGVLRNPRRCGGLHAHELVRHGRAARDARRHAGRRDVALDGREEFARQVGDRPLRAAQP